MAAVFFASFRQIPTGGRRTFDASRAARDVKAGMTASGRSAAERPVAARIAPPTAPVPDTADVTQPDGTAK